MSPDSAGHEGPLAEFLALRQEIERRAVNQQTLFALQLTISGAVFGFAISDRSRVLLLLILPFTTYMICGRFVSQHYGIGRASTYIKEELSRRVPGGLHWEEWVIEHRRPKLFFLEWVDPHYVTFPGVALLSLAWVAPPVFFQPAPAPALRAGLIVSWCLGLIAMAASLYMTWFARRGWWRLHRRWLPAVPAVTPSPDSAARESPA